MKTPENVKKDIADINAINPKTYSLRYNFLKHILYLLEVKCDENYYSMELERLNKIIDSDALNNWGSPKQIKARQAERGIPAIKRQIVALKYILS